MKLAYYHYFFKEAHKRNAPRYIHDINPILKAYTDYTDITFKKEMKGNDGNTLLLMPTTRPNIYMLVVTREEEIIKAINMRDLKCEDVQKRFSEDESCGFAAYFLVTDRLIAIAATTHGPRAAALDRFITMLLERLGIFQWRMRKQALGDSITVNQARSMAHISTANVKIGKDHPLYARFKQLLSLGQDPVESFQVIIRGKRKKNIKDSAMRIVSQAAGCPGLDRLTIRAKAALDDMLTDYFVEKEGRFGEDIGRGTESQIVNRIASRYRQSNHITPLVSDMMDAHMYDNKPIQALAPLADVAHWPDLLQSDAVGAG